MSKFPKEERLNSRKRIAYLVSQGQPLHAFPFRVHWCLSQAACDGFHLEAAFSVPKRKHKKATSRNRIKRKMREAFRLHKETFKTSLDGVNQTLSLLIIYTPKKEVDYHTMEKGMMELFSTLEKKLNEKTP
jgi:ribonuclease P protein component